MNLQTDPATFRRQIYVILIAVTASIVFGRTMATLRVYEPNLSRKNASDPDPRGLWPAVRPEPVPTFSSNDRSRWATIRALVDDGTYIIGTREVDPVTKKYRDSGIIFEDGWQSVDKVMNPEPDPNRPNVYHFYSSKPPLLPTLLAGEYWLLQKIFGWTLKDDINTVVRVMIITVNWLPLLLYWWLLAQLAERFGTTDWGRVYVVAAGCFGTFLTTFAISLNNHTMAACTALYALYVALDIWSNPGTSLGWYFLAGLAAAFTAAVELPATAFLVGLFAVLLWRAPRPTLLGFAPAAVLVVIAGFMTNYAAIGRLTPAYSEAGEKSEWYHYEGSHWLEVPGKPKRGIDFAYNRETRAQYIAHFLIGHHGIFLLSPIFLLGVIGTVYTLKQGQRKAIEPPTPESERETQLERDPAQEKTTAEKSTRITLTPPPPLGPFPLIAVMTTYLTIVVVGFYLVKTNNYGGNTSGPRWAFWLTPFWLLTMNPIADRLSTSRWGRILAYVLLGISVMSASYPAWNPWRQPWAYQFMEAQGWISY